MLKPALDLNKPTVFTFTKNKITLLFVFIWINYAAHKHKGQRIAMSLPYKKYICVICGFIYDEAEGWPEDGIEPETRWEDVPENWFCPDCGASKIDFEMIEMD